MGGFVFTLGQAPVIALLLKALRVLSCELFAGPRKNCHGGAALTGFDTVEALRLLANTRRGRRARLDDERWARASHEVACAVDGRVVVMSCQKHVDPSVADCVKRKLASSAPEPSPIASIRSAAVRMDEAGGSACRPTWSDASACGPAGSATDAARTVSISSFETTGRRSLARSFPIGKLAPAAAHNYFLPRFAALACEAASFLD